MLDYYFIYLNLYFNVSVLLLSPLIDRLDQTLGKPGTIFGGSERDKQKMTITSRLGRVETQVGSPVIFDSFTLINLEIISHYNRIMFL